MEKMKKDISRVVNTKADLDEEREDLENELKQVIICLPTSLNRQENGLVVFYSKKSFLS